MTDIFIQDISFVRQFFFIEVYRILFEIFVCWLNLQIWRGKLFPEFVTNVLYGTAKKKRPASYLVGNLVATNWPIEKALHAIGYNQIPTK